jgi:nucleoside-diphosphate-sugar epimerase
MKENGKTVVVIGSDGYLGHALTVRLLFGGYLVAAIDDFQRRRHVKQMGSFSAIDIGEPENRFEVLKKFHFDFLEADISQESDMDQVEDFLEFCDPVAVVNLAQQPSAPFSLKSRDHAVDTTKNNLIGTLNILYWMKEHAPKAQLIQIGSMGEYDPAAGTDIPEGVFDLEYMGRTGKNMIFPRRPGSFYHASKVASTYYIDCACRWWGMCATDIMQGVVYGNYSPEMEELNLPTRLDSDEAFGTVINRFAVQAVLGEPLTVFGEGMQRRGYLSVSDSIQCLMLAIENPPVSGEYRTWNQLDTVYTVVELAHIVKSVCLLPVEIQHIPSPRAERTDSFYYRPYVEKLKYLGFEPKRTIEQEVDYMIRRLMPVKSELFPLVNVVTPNIKWK